MQKREDFGKRECEEGYTRTCEGGGGKIHCMSSRKEEEDMTRLVTAQVLQRQGFVIGTCQGGIHCRLR